MQQEVGHAGRQTVSDPQLRAQLQSLMQYLPLRDEIEGFWRDPEQQRTSSWIEHQDINEVMLATSLSPDGFLVLLPARE
jgi:hypothetical protein